MNRPRGRFGRAEIDGADTASTDRELAGAEFMARDLETTTSASEHVRPTAAFIDRVMAAVALEPTPRPTGFLAPLRRDRSPLGLVRSLRAAWSVARTGRRPVRARAMAMAYVLVVAVALGSVTGIAGYGAAGALGLVGPAPTSGPTSTAPTSPLPAESTEPSETPEPSVEPGESEAPSPGDAEPSSPATSGEPDGSGDGSSAGSWPQEADRLSTGDGGVVETSGTSQPTQAPDAAGTPKPSQAPETSHSPQPTSTSGG